MLTQPSFHLVLLVFYFHQDVARCKKNSIASCKSRYFQDGIEKIEAAYEVFLEQGLDDFPSFVFELKTIVAQNLTPARIKTYLEIIFR